MKSIWPYPDEEVERRAKDIYERVIKPTLSKGDIGKFLAIDIETGDYEMDKDDWTVSDRLSKRRPAAPPYLVLIGYPYPAKLGGCWPKGSGESLEWMLPGSRQQIACGNGIQKSIWGCSDEEAFQRAKEIYQRVVKPTLNNSDIGKFLAIDIESEDYEMDKDDWTACDRLSKRRPGVPPFILRIGYPTPYKLSGAWPKGSGESL